MEYLSAVALSLPDSFDPNLFHRWRQWGSWVAPASRALHCIGAQHYWCPSFVPTIALVPTIAFVPTIGAHQCIGAHHYWSPPLVPNIIGAHHWCPPLLVPSIAFVPTIIGAHYWCPPLMPTTIGAHQGRMYKMQSWSMARFRWQMAPMHRMLWP